MKTFKIVTKIVVALAAVAGAVYVFATYGDKIVQWCKDLLNRLPCKCCCEEDFCKDVEEEAPVVAAEEGTVVAEEADFEG